MPRKETHYKHPHQRSPATASLGGPFGLRRLTPFCGLGRGGVAGPSGLPCAGSPCPAGLWRHHCQLFGRNSLGPRDARAADVAARPVCVGRLPQPGSLVGIVVAALPRAGNAGAAARHLPGGGPAQLPGL